MNALQNPYTSMLLTFNPERFYGRSQEIISILQVITANDPTGHAIYGSRTVGRTTLLKYLRDPDGAVYHYEEYLNVNFQPGGEYQLAFVYINLHNFTAEDSVFYRLLKYLSALVDDEELGEIIHIPRFDKNTSIQQLVDCIRDTCRQFDDQHLRIVFLLDDFDTALPHLGDDDDRLMRSLSEVAPIILATNMPIVEMRPDLKDDSPFLGILRPEPIRLLEQRAARQLIQEPADDVSAPFSEPDVDFLLEVAGRYPFYLIAACELYFDMKQTFPDIAQRLESSEQRTLFKQQFIFRLNRSTHVERILKTTWNSLNEREKATLRHMAQVGGTIDMMSEHGVMAEHLLNKALTYSNMLDGSYHTFSDLFTTFIQQQMQEPQVNTAVMDEETLSTLTPIDRALLEYMIQHQDKVLAFEQIITDVWQDESTSKRALEAAVYRLRNNIKTGEIKNVRGKGYKFVLTQKTT